MKRFRTRSVVLAALILAAVVSVSAQEVPAALSGGLEDFQSGNYSAAATGFRAVIADPASRPYQGHGYYWLGRALLAQNRITDAADTFDRFLGSFPDHPYREDARYQRARLFHLTGEQDAAIQAFSAFVDDYPDSDLVANALYWTGESLFALGVLEEARSFFVEVAENYPSSFRAEAARYRRDIIDLTQREQELLKLLRWSHEEYLGALDEFQQREQSYREALSAYRDRIAGLASEDFQSEIESLGDRVTELEAQVAQRDTRINELLGQVRQLQTTASAGQSTSTSTASATTDSTAAVEQEVRDELLSLRAQAMELQRLLQQGDGGQ